jgi:hypothetical protein
MSVVHASERFTRTKTGLVIGAAYTRPPEPIGSEAERIQSALLGSGGAMPPSKWLSIDSLIDDEVAANRSLFDEAMEELPAVRIAPLRRNSVIPLDGSLLGRLSRWLRNLRIGGRP